MKLHIQQKNLLQALQRSARFITNRPQLPILSSFLLQTDGEHIYLFATDLQAGIRQTLIGKIIEPGSCVIPGKIFTDFIASLNDQEVELTSQDQQLIVNSKKDSAKFPMFAPDDFPPFPEMPEQGVDIPLDLLKNCQEKVAFATSKDETRPILTTLYFSIDEEITAVATDGFRLAMKSSPNSSQLMKQNNLISAKILHEVTKFETASAVVHFADSIKLKQLFFTFPEAVIVTQKIEGDFPPYQAIMPKEFAFEHRIDTESLSQAIKTALIFARDSSGVVRFSFSESEMLVTASSISLGEYQKSIALDKDVGEQHSIAFNGKYVLDFLQQVEDKEVVFKMNDEVKSGVFTLVKDNSYLYVVMPFRLNQAS